MKAIGITCGVGSLLIGAKQAGFEIVGNLEWRKYYHHRGDDGKNTFTENFPGAFFAKKLEDLTPEQIEMMTGADLACGHPECGNFSNLQTSKRAGDLMKDPGDIPLFCELVAKFKPRFFIMDDLPKAFTAFAMEDYAKILTEYDLFPEWVSNHGYGNTQINRKRFFMIGALKSENFVFRAGEFHHKKTILDVIAGLHDHEDDVELNHLHQKDDVVIEAGWSRYHLGLEEPPEKPGKANKPTLAEMKDYIRDYPVNRCLLYINRQREQKQRPGYMKIRVDQHALVLTGGGAALDNHYRADTLNPLTIRERLRIQGAPDDFIVYPLNYLKDRKTYDAVFKQTGKFMPVEFGLFCAQQFAAHIKGEPFEATDARMLKPSPYIEEAKKWYCREVGYQDQEKACRYCHSNGACDGPQLKLEKSINLCETCNKEVAICDGQVEFGNGVGNDNIIKCDKFEATAATSTDPTIVDINHEEE